MGHPVKDQIIILTRSTMNQYCFFINIKKYKKNFKLLTLVIISNRNQLNLVVMLDQTDPCLDLKALTDPRLVLATMLDRRLFSGNHTRLMRLGLPPYMVVNPCPGLTPNMVVIFKNLRSCVVPRLK